MSLSQEQIDKIYKISDWCVKGIILIGLVVLFFKPGNWFWWVFFIMLSISMIVNAVSRHFATDEEKAERKEEIREVFREMQITPSKDEYNNIDESSPLSNLSKEQKMRVEQFLHDLPPHKERKDEINMKEVAAFINALIKLGYISGAKSVDTKGLMEWVEKVTKKHAPEQYRFNASLRDVSDKSTAKYIEKIREIQ